MPARCYSEEYGLWLTAFEKVQTGCLLSIYDHTCMSYCFEVFCRQDELGGDGKVLVPSLADSVTSLN